MAREQSRDNMMYPKLDPKYIKEVKREMRKKKLNLNDQIPNTLKQDQSISVLTSTDAGSGF